MNTAPWYPRAPKTLLPKGCKIDTLLSTADHRRVLRLLKKRRDDRAVSRSFAVGSVQVKDEGSERELIVRFDRNR